MKFNERLILFADDDDIYTHKNSTSFKICDICSAILNVNSLLLLVSEFKSGKHKIVINAANKIG